MNSRIINQLKENLQNHKFYVCINNELITSDLLFIKKFVSQINKLRVDAYSLNSNDMEEIKCTLSNSNVKVCFVTKILIIRTIMLFDSEKQTNKKIIKITCIKSFIINFC